MNNTAIAECFKCLGRGRFEPFSHVAGGVCFQCGGAGKITLRNLGRTDGKSAARELTRQQLINLCTTSLGYLEGWKNAADGLGQMDRELGIAPARLAEVLPADVRARYLAALSKLGINV